MSDVVSERKDPDTSEPITPSHRDDAFVVWVTDPTHLFAPDVLRGSSASAVAKEFARKHLGFGSKSTLRSAMLPRVRPKTPDSSLSSKVPPGPPNSEKFDEAPEPRETRSHGKPQQGHPPPSRAPKPKPDPEAASDSEPPELVGYISPIKIL